MSQCLNPNCLYQNPPGTKFCQRCGSKLLIGRTLLSRYKIIGELGSGGFGDTYLAIDIALPGHPRCVVKHLLPKDPNPAVLPIAENLFEREAQFLYYLGRHDQIPALNAHFCEDGEFYLVEEFVEGDELSKEITPGKKLSEEQTVELLKEILKVLAVVHQQNVIHRDIKPSNIMRRTRDGKLVLIDFGAVKEIRGLAVDSRGQTTITIAIGSPGYMPNEQFIGRPKLASDVYAVGMIGIQALTGLAPSQLPEDPDTGEIIWRNQVQVSDRLADVLDKMVRYYFSQRYRNASDALQGLMTTFVYSTPSPDAPTVPIVSSQTQRSPSPANKSRQRLIGVGIAAALVVTFFFLARTPQLGENRETQPPPPRPQPTVELNPIPSPTPRPSTTTSPARESTLISAVTGVDYTPLHDLLAAGKWKEADKETRRTLLQAADREREGWLRRKDIDKFSCEDLRIIDQLWRKSSQGRFGFSVQKEIYQNLDGKRKYNQEAKGIFGDRVGWRKRGRWLDYSELIFNLNAPKGQLPVVRVGGQAVTGGRFGYDAADYATRDSLAQLSVTCNI